MQVSRCLEIVTLPDSSLVLEHRGLKGLKSGQIPVTLAKNIFNKDQIPPTKLLMTEPVTGAAYLCDRKEVSRVVTLPSPDDPSPPLFEELSKRLNETQIIFTETHTLSGNALTAWSRDWENKLVQSIIYALKNRPLQLADQFSTSIPKEPTTLPIGIFYSPSRRVYLKYGPVIYRGNKVIQNVLELTTRTLYKRAKPNLKPVEGGEKRQTLHRNAWIKERDVYSELQKLSKRPKWIMTAHEIIFYQKQRANGKIELKSQMIFESFSSDLLDLVNDQCLSLRQKKVLARAVVKAPIEFEEVLRKFHGDLKLDNFLFDLQDVVKLMDFGYAKGTLVNSNYTGTVQYVPPEVKKNQPINEEFKESWQVGIMIWMIFKSSVPDFVDPLINGNFEDFSAKFKQFHDKDHTMPYQGIMKALLKETPIERITLFEADKQMAKEDGLV